MIHGPLNSQSRFMQIIEGGDRQTTVCTKNYPWPLLQHTQTGNDGYSLY